jgi:hypothetical protein
MTYRVVNEDEYGKQYESEWTGNLIPKEQILNRRESEVLAEEELSRRGIRP